MKRALSHVARNTSWLVLGEVVVKGSVLLITVLVGRTAGHGALGVFTVSMGAALVAASLTATGQVEVVIRSAARTPGSVRELLVAARRAQWRWLWLGAPLALLAVMSVPDAELRHSLLTFFPYALLRMEVMTRSAAFKGLDRMDVEVSARVVELVVAILLIAGTIWFGAPTWTFGLSLSIGGAAGLMTMLARQKSLPPRPPGAEADGGVSPGSLFREGLPFLGIGVLLQLLLRSDTFLLVSLGVAKEDVGSYAAAAAILWGLLAVSQLIAVALYPTLARHSLGRTKPWPIAAIVGVTGLLLGTSLSVSVWWLRRPILGLLFGDAFAPSAEFLGWLIWALPGASVTMVLGVVLASWHRQLWNLFGLAATLTGLVALSVVWIPADGPLGAARAMVVVQSLGALGTFVLAAWPAGAGEGGRDAPR